MMPDRTSRYWRQFCHQEGQGEQVKQWAFGQEGSSLGGGSGVPFLSSQGLLNEVSQADRLQELYPWGINIQSFSLDKYF